MIRWARLRILWHAVGATYNAPDDTQSHESACGLSMPELAPPSSISDFVPYTRDRCPSCTRLVELRREHEMGARVG